MSESLVVGRLRDLSDEALREIQWDDLAAYMDELHAEYERFVDLLNARKIGRARRHEPPSEAGEAMRIDPRTTLGVRP